MCSRRAGRAWRRWTCRSAWLVDACHTVKLKLSYPTRHGRAPRRARLEALDVSWCRGIPEEALGRLVDACPALATLTLFGCSQVGPLNPMFFFFSSPMTYLRLGSSPASLPADKRPAWKSSSSI